MAKNRNLTRRTFVGAAAATAVASALPSIAFGADDVLWKLWVRYVTGGAPYRASFPAMFLDPMFVEMEIVPADLPVGGYSGYNPFAIPDPAPAGTAPPPAPAPAIPGFGNAAPIVVDNAPDTPWIPSTQLKSGIRQLMPGAAPVFSVLIANDQTDWPEDGRTAVQNAVKQKKGFVIIQNALGDNQNWPWWYQEVTGGHLILKDHDGMKQSTVTPNTMLEVRPAGNHPIVRDLPAMRLAGETAYKGMWQSPKITPLLETSSGASDRVVAWVGPDSGARVVCIQPGAAMDTHRNPAYRKLVRNALLWAGGRLD
jgi:Trehalose utilisation